MDDALSVTGLSRRDALKRGVVIAGAVWAVPVVQALSVSEASAEAPSGRGLPRRIRGLLPL